MRNALKSLWRAPGFTAAAALVLAAGVGGSTAVFSVLRSVVLRPLGLPQPESLLRLYERPAGTESQWPYSAPDYLDLVKESGAFESLAAIRPTMQTLTGRGSPVQIRTARVTASFYKTLRTQPAIGSAPGPEEDVAGGPRTAVLSDSFWRRELNADPAALGSTLVLDGRSYTIGGVMPRDFQFPLLRKAEVLVPVAYEPFELERRGRMWLQVVGRLKPGLTRADAQADLAILAPRIGGRITEHNNWGQEAQPLLDDLVGPVKPALAALLAAVLLALLIACANVASLLLARGLSRQRELGIRAALGASRADLVGQLMAEAMLIAAIGGALSLAVAQLALPALVALAPRDLPRLEEVRVDGEVLAFALAASLLAGLLAGLLPALQATRPRLMEVLKNGAGGTAGRARARSALVVAETALAFVLAAGAGLMIRTLSVLLNTPTGLAAAEQVYVADLDLPQARYPEPRLFAFAQQLVERVPGSALMSSLPIDPRGQSEHGFLLDGGDAFPPGQSPKTEVVFATPGYLRTIGIPLLRGRDLRLGDVKSAPHVLLVNESFVRRYLPRGEPIGRRIAQILGPDNPWEIVGIIGDVKTRGLDQAPGPMVIIPLAQWPVGTLRVAVRGAGALSLLRAEVSALDKDLALSPPQALSRVIAESTGERRFQMTLLTIFALAALALAAQGIYGVTSYSVAQRTREIGIRMALGADSSMLIRLVVGGALRLSLLGVVLGLLGAFAGTRMLASLVYQVSTTDPLTLLAAAAVLVCTSAFASWLPARRATRVDPALSLRAE